MAPLSRLVIYFFVSVFILTALVHLSVGAVQLPLSEVINWLLGNAEPQTETIIGQLRLPRLLLAISVGCCLAVCGCATQALFRNPLADPALIGVSAGASAGASLVIVFFADQHWQWFGVSLVSLGAFLGGLSIVWLVFKLSSSEYGSSVVTMLLAGIAFSYLAGSLSNVMELLADHNALKRISLWRMGGLDGADFYRAGIMVGISILVWLWLWRLRQALNILLLGESEVRHLGFHLNALRWQIIACVALGVGTAVAMAGAIAFVGLVVPHMVRMWVGPDHRLLLPLSGVLGSVLVVVADTLARILIAPGEIPVGLLISFIGAPVFIFLLKKRMHYASGH